MDSNYIKNIDILDDIIIGRVEPHIYAFSTNTVPNYIKVGDTYRAVTTRLNEWKRIFPDLNKEYEDKAVVSDCIYFRDHSVHNFLEKDLVKYRLKRSDLEGLGILDKNKFSKEFFKDTKKEDIKVAIEDIKKNYETNSGKYTYYSSNNKLPETFRYRRQDTWELRPNQQEVVENFRIALENNRANLLMYAVMRFGKSFTSMSCALEMNAKVILVVSGKADVRDEWKKTVEIPGNFKDYMFLDSRDLLLDSEAIKMILAKNKRVVIFLTLQDLQGDEIKEKHKEVFDNEIDLLIVDETHFGARAESFGEILRANDQGYDTKDLKNIEKLNDEIVEIKNAEEQLKFLKTKIRLHLSGTPYRILMGSEFEKEDIISFVQFSDIVREQKTWDEENLMKDNVNEWDNPYYGFPQMVRFAFTPNKSSIKKMKELKKLGISFAFSALFEPYSIQKDDNNQGHKKFKHEKEIFDLLKVIDGTEEDENLFGFLDYEKIKDGNMCRHMVMVLPYCASCDAMESLIIKNKGMFKNLNDYEIINISGVEGAANYKKPKDVKDTIKILESEGKKTITLTVNRMLTGSTVEEWDTMLYLKDTSSPQEYDQAIFRLQNQYIRTLSNDKNNNDDLIKENMKPQTLLVDFDPHRLFIMQEQKSLIYNVNTDESGNTKLRKRIEDELRISPVITMNKNKIKEIEATDIIDAVSKYNNERSVIDEVKDLPIDLSILAYEEIRNEIEKQAEFDSKGGLIIEPTDDEGDDYDFEEVKGEDGKATEKDLEKNKQTSTEGEDNSLEKKILTYYQRILFYAFLTDDHVTSLDDITNTIEKEENQSIANNLFLDSYVLELVANAMDPFKRNSLDYKINNISRLANDNSLTPLERATTSIKKFNRMSDSEIITPSKVCEDMVKLIPDNGFKIITEDDEKILDIASKSGEFAVAIYNHLVNKLDFSQDEIYNLIYSIPTSSIAYEFTRKFYEILGLNIDNIAKRFNAYDLVNEGKNGMNYEEIVSTLTQSKKFSDISLSNNVREGDDRVKFGAVVGNPPYQVSDGGAGASARPIYQHFVELAKLLGSKYQSLIIPTRWFAGGKGLDSFRERMLSDKGIRELHDFLSPEDVFPETNNRGGVCYFIAEQNKEFDKTRVVTYKNNEVIADKKRKLKTLDINIFIRDSIGGSIIEKVFKENLDQNLSQIVSPRKPFGIESNIIKTDKFNINSNVFEIPIKCIGRNRVEGFIEMKEILSNKDWINKWKVYVPRANNIGTELSDDNLNAFIGEPDSICTEAYIVIGGNLDLTKDSARNLVKYMQTKFARYLHSQAKASHDASRKTYRFIPMQNFDEDSDVDWTLAVDEIDSQLFRKYKLTKEEKNHIRNSIKEM